MLNERRDTADQRSTPTKPVSLQSLKGRRKKMRRVEEERNYYVDRYEPRYFVLVSLILILCVLDAYFTLKILDLGGREMNFFMFALLYKKPILAMAFKYLVTVFGVTIILVHKNFVVFGRLKVDGLIYAIFFFYLLLVLYEATMLLTTNRVLIL
jgi:membrane glycosyltransferase